MSQDPVLKAVMSLEIPLARPRILKTVEEVLAARRPTCDRAPLYTDCLRIARYEGYDGFWISTPNMTVIPELPEQNPTEPVAYFADGMLGLNEHLKWPQKYYQDWPHAMGAPANPNLLHFQTPERVTSDGQDLYTYDVQGVLPVFADRKAPWFDIFAGDFTVTDELAHAHVGVPSSAVITRLKLALADVLSKWEKLAERLSRGALSRQTGSAQTKELNSYGQSVAHRLRYACSVLSRGNLTSFHTLLWFREFQRHLLDLQALIIYMDVIKPRLDDTTSDFSRHTLPLRGIITSNEWLVHEAFRVGIPVWWVRPQESLTTDTMIRKVCAPVKSTIAFSSKRSMRHGKFQATAPIWSQAPNDDPSSGNILLRMQKLLLTNHAIVGAVTSYDAQQVETLESGTSHDVGTSEEEIEEIFTGPDVKIEDLPDPDLGDEGGTLTATWPPSGNSSWHDEATKVELGAVPSTTVKKEAVDTHPVASLSPSSASPAVPSKSITKGAVSRRAGRQGSSRCGKGKEKVSVSVTRPINVPSWMPPESPGWADAFNACGLGDEEEFPKTFHLPPPHLFISLGNEGAVGIIARFHNWIRIRRWCYDTAVNTPAHGMVLFTSTQWRIALLGQYYRVEHVVAEDEDLQVAQARQQAMMLLQPHPKSIKQEEENDVKPPPAKKPRLDGQRETYKVRRKQNDLAARAAIHVRFGVHGNFPPYTDDIKPSWNGRIVTKKDVENGKDIWAAVVWELSVVMFRLELLQLDRHYCPALYDGQDGGFNRSQTISLVWANDGMVLPDWSSTDEMDLLSSAKPAIRTAALHRFAEVLSIWPGGNVLSGVTDDVRVFSFYIRAAYKCLDRVPIVPRIRPV